MIVWLLRPSRMTYEAYADAIAALFPAENSVRTCSVHCVL